MSCSKCHCPNGLDVLTIAHPNTKGLDNVDKINPKDLARIIDHTYLKPDGDRAQIEKLCAEARKYNFASVCVNTTMVHLASELRCGAVEVDMVINVGALKSKDYALVEYDIRKVVQGVEGTLVKVIIETCLLTDEEKVIACALSKAAGAHFVKTSTGFFSSALIVVL